MTTHKPEVRRYTPSYGVDSVMRGHLFMEECDHGAWVSLEDYEALQAEFEKLRNLLRHAQPIIRAHAEASHMLEGVRPRRNQWDELVEGIDTAMQEAAHESH